MSAAVRHASHAFPPAPGMHPLPNARHRSGNGQGVGSQLSSATAYVPSSLLHVQLYSPVPMRFVSAHRQLSSGSHVVGSHPLTACVGFRLFPYGSHCSPTAESNAPLPHVGGGGGLGGGGLGGGLGAVSQTVAATLEPVTMSPATLLKPMSQRTQVPTPPFTCTR